MQQHFDETKLLPNDILCSTAYFIMAQHNEAVTTLHPPTHGSCWWAVPAHADRHSVACSDGRSIDTYRYLSILESINKYRYFFLVSISSY